MPFRSFFIKCFKFSILSLVVLPLSFCKHQVLIQSAPDEALVYLVDGNREIRMGKTPLDISSQDAYRNASTNIVYIKVDKLEYEPMMIAVDKSQNTSSQFKVQLHRKKFDESSILETLIRYDRKNVDPLLKEILTIQNLLIEGKMQEAETQLDDLAKKHRKLSILFVLKANLLLNKKEEAEAIRMYKKAQELDPSNAHVSLMLDQLTNKKKK